MTVTQSNGIWKVPISASHKPYNVINFKRRFPTLDSYCVVVVDMQAFMECYSRNQHGSIIPTVEAWTQEKKEVIRRFLDPSEEGTPEMPIVSFEFSVRKRWFGLMQDVVGVISFTNGRHRSRYLQYSGAKCFPVELHISYAEKVREYCGCRCCN